MEKMGLIIGEPKQYQLLLDSCQIKEMDNATCYINDKWVVMSRYGFNGAYLLPHEYDLQPIFQTFKDLGIKEIIGFHSSGSLRPSLSPGTLVVVDDWINFNPAPSILKGVRRHPTPKLSLKLRQDLLSAAWRAELKCENGGVYWQTCGPRLETKAEIKVMSRFADVVGMDALADSAALAQELELEFAAICSVDNYANGLSSPILTDSFIMDQSSFNAIALNKLLENF